VCVSALFFSLENSILNSSYAAALHIDSLRAHVGADPDDGADGWSDTSFLFSNPALKFDAVRALFRSALTVADDALYVSEFILRFFWI
jgi:hypothetical protein